MIRYDIDPGAEACTFGAEEELPYFITQAHQVHGDRIACIERKGVPREELEGYDALLTSLPDCPIAVRTADCIPVLLFDPVRGAAAAVHAGWKGTVLGITEKAVGEMSLRFGTDPADLKAAVGPGICRRCFQVGEEVVEKFREAGFDTKRIHAFFGEKREGDPSTGHHIDLKEANRLLLLRAGVRERNITVSDECTFENEGLCSARRQGTACGRNINMIMIKKKQI